MLVIKGGLVITMDGDDIEDGIIQIDKDSGKIVAVGKDLTINDGDEVIEAAGKVIHPGYLDTHTHLGLHEEGIGWEGRDVNELTDPVTPQMRALDGVYMDDEGFRDALKAGITTVEVKPGSGNVIGGQCVTLKTWSPGPGRIVESAVLRAPSGMKAAFGENPKRVYSEQKKLPSTRMGTAAAFREAIIRTLNYIEKVTKAEPDKPFERDLKLESLALVLRGEIPFRIHSHRADDIMTVLRIRDEFGFPMVLEHCTEAWKVAEELVKRDIACSVGPLMTSRSKVELRDRTFRAPALLQKAGVKISICTDHPVIPIQHLVTQVIIAVRDGLDGREALKAVTINPAEMLGVADRVGSIAAGKDADIVIRDRHPLDITSQVEQVLISGKVVCSRRADALEHSPGDEYEIA